MIKVKHLAKSYGNRKVVKDVSLEVSAGEIVALLGPNGAGKTTSFYMIVGLVRPDKGKISLSSKDISDMPMHERAKLGIGYLPQESSIFRGLNVRDNIMAILEIVENDYYVRETRLHQLMEEFSISHLETVESVNLSGGERRRLEIARALASNPKFIFLDEPMAGIDPIAVSDIKNMILKLKKKNIGVVITDHNVREALSISDRVYVITDGSILLSGSTKEVINNKIVQEVYLGDSFKL